VIRKNKSLEEIFAILVKNEIKIDVLCVGVFYWVFLNGKHINAH
jgi:hypothetical protein